MRLARTYGEPELERRAQAVVEQVGTLLARAPQGFGHLLGVCDALLSPPREAAVVGAADDPATAELAAALLAPYEPDLAVAFGDGSDDRGVPLLAGRGLVDGQRGRIRVQRVRLRGAGDGRSHGAHSLA